MDKFIADDSDSTESHLVSEGFHLVLGILNLVLVSTDVCFCYVVYKTDASILQCVISMLWAPSGWSLFDAISNLPSGTSHVTSVLVAFIGVGISTSCRIP
ncbi:hypothetical protein L1987_54266 [Smallanthus sonchifolius]|uniref:Uncharacterized protein n=1 Tax=Smallanthus sonchifolius TaxID=185202 RepID=A0ACB9E7S6_9ASTR|nr:hypothetical protein L1987_54266 [Smallanthus sonchifolius]